MNVERMRWARRRTFARIQLLSQGAFVPHPSSYPYPSGDTFRDFCFREIQTQRDLSSLIRSTNRGGHSPSLFFSPEAAEALLDKVPRTLAEECVVIIHNGDRIPSRLLEKVAPGYRRILSVNWLGSTELVHPIPIGLENRRLGRNGNVKFYPDFPLGPIQTSDERTVPVLMAFSDATNFRVRQEVRRVARQFHSSVLEVNVPRRQYGGLLRSSLFVLSPPGNGADCHRTWEAIYSGAIPVVHENYWPDFSMNLPVLVVRDWREGLSQIQDAPYSLYDQIMKSARGSWAAHEFLPPDLLSYFTSRHLRKRVAHDFETRQNS